MAAGRRTVSALLLVVGLVLSVPAVLYGIGLFKVHGRPIPADPARFSAAEISTAWGRCRETLPLTVSPLNPWGYTAKVLSGASDLDSAGAIAAWQVASVHNATNPVGNTGWWKLSGAALTIWITRQWSAEQIGATLVRDNLCRATPNKSLERTRER
jgi:hypothetical protein